MEMAIDKLISEYEGTAKRVTNIRTTEQNLAQELIRTIKKQQEDYEALQQAKRPIIGPAEIKKQIKELEDAVERLKQELAVKNSAIVALQSKIKELTPSSLSNMNEPKQSFLKSLWRKQ